MIEFTRKMEMEITITDPRYTEEDIAIGLSSGLFQMGDSDPESEDFGKIYNNVWDEIAVINDSHVAEVDAPDQNFAVI